MLLLFLYTEFYARYILEGVSSEVSEWIGTENSLLNGAEPKK